MWKPVRRPSLALALLLAAASLVGVARPAGACTCAAFDTRAALTAASAAFVGTFESRTDPLLGAGDTVYRFRVDQAVKGDLGDEVEVRAPGSEASCGLSAPAGRPVGVLLSERDGSYHGDLCRQPSPERLLRAAAPLPAPEGRLPPWVLVGSTYGNGRSVALDDGGRVAGVGSGAGTTTAVAVCPDRHRVVELFTVPGADGTDTQGITVRRLDTMATESERLLPELRPTRAEAVACRDVAATDVVLLTREGAEAEGRGRLVRLVAGQAPAVLWEGAAPRSAAFGPAGRTAYLNLYPQGEEILAIDVDRPGDAAVVARVPAGSGPMTASPDGRRLATVTLGASRPSQVVSVDLKPSGTGTAGSPVVTAVDLSSAGVTGDVQWVGDNLVFMPVLRPAEPVRIYDPGLLLLASWAGWTAEHSVVIGERLYGASQGAVRSAPVTTGPEAVVRELEDALVVSIADVSPPQAEAPAPTPATTTTTTTRPKPASTSTTTAPKPAPTTTTTAVPETTTTTAMPEPSTSTRPEVAGRSASKGGGGGGGGAGGALALLGALVLVAGGGGAVLFRMRRRAEPPT